MTAEEFRRLALNLPETVEATHMAHPDFRVGGKIFALGYPFGEWGFVKLTPEQQRIFMQVEPEVFIPAKGVWGHRGGTTIRLRAAPKAMVRKALLTAWRNTAPKRLARELDSV